ncbi:fimbrial protein [Providencia sneebia]|uniref:Fimbrial adhesin n=1 Tax=Providencia sneebia DSM 19967 TaxID=1141660 RepID=K8WA47_9GAMM|nr:fimbrial protein [Providencia sneebia]EKT57394.1 fimbrial adhesin [Providencia sneebia DSM 19967]
MIKLATVCCASLIFLYSQSSFAEFRSEFTTKTITKNETLYVSRSLPVGSFIGSVDLNSHNAWAWWNISGTTWVGIFLPSIGAGTFKSAEGGYVRPIPGSGIGYALHGTVTGPCSGSAFVDGQNNMDKNISNRMICRSNATSAFYGVKLRADFYKLSNNVPTQTLPTIRAAMLILYHNGFITSDYYGNKEPNVYLSGIKVVSSGCDVKNPSINVPIGKISKATFSGVGSTSPDSKKKIKIQLDCDPITPIKITFVGTQDESKTAGAIALNNLNDVNTAQGYAIQVKYNNSPIKLNQIMEIVKSNTAGQYEIPLEAAYIQTKSVTKAGQANGTLQFNMRYH